MAGSRTRRYAADVHLVSWVGGKGTDHPYRSNSGWAATYDEWGWFLAHVFAADPSAIAGPYKGIDDFHAQVDGKAPGRGQDPRPFRLVPVSA